MSDEPKSFWGKLALLTAFLTAVGTLGTQLTKCSENGDSALAFSAPTRSPPANPISQIQPSVHPTGFPSGYGMQVCGCWGYDPAPVAPEPLCASGAVRLNPCSGYCPGGGIQYAYVCQ
ncbi:MAG TPA: hypothetical protein VEC06_12520 [Paucimonas sp.]|nr:hypothetical protein [Paucimonas sp.]